MREILFRGKRKDNGEWAFGYFALITEDDRPAIRVRESDWHSWVDVSPETVGQFTGLSDKNKKKIFDGDILLAPNKKKAVVSFGTYSPYIGSPGADTFECWKLKVGNNECPLTKTISVEMEIIGNIYDNPELIS